MNKQPVSVVSGAAGFLGSHLCDRLIADGHRVIGMDNLSTGSLDNIAHLLQHERFTFYRYDITHFVYVQGGVDFILHFASPASPIDYLNIPIQTLKVGALGTHNLLGLARAKRARILVASTSEIYGDPLEHPQKEDYLGNVSTIGPRGVYDEAKRFMESITMAYHRYHNVDIRIARIFNTYGERMRPDDGRVLPTFMKQALTNQPLTAFGDGTQTRSFCYVSDMIRGICSLLYSDYTYPVNLGNPQEITINELAEEILALSRSHANHPPPPPPSNFYPYPKAIRKSAGQTSRWPKTFSVGCLSFLDKRG